MNKEIVLGIDPALNLMGVVLSDGVDIFFNTTFKQDSKTSQEERLHNIYEFVDGIIVEWKPSVIVVEGQFFGTMTEAKTPIKMLSGKHKIPLVTYAPKQWKKEVLGIGNVDKKSEIKELMNERHAISRQLKKPDEIDALGLIICYLSKNGKYASR